MAIAKRLVPEHVISPDEAVAEHVRGLSDRDRKDFLWGTTATNVMYPITFNSVALWRLMTDRPNNYELAADRIAVRMQEVGRKARLNCQLCVTAVEPHGERSVANLEVECQRMGCPEDGLLAVERACAELPARAAEEEIQTYIGPTVLR